MRNEDIKDLLQMIMTCSKNLDAKLTLDSGCCKCLLEYIDNLDKEKEQLRLILGNQVRIKDELSKKRDIAIGILKTWKDYCEVNLKNDKNHWIYCIEKIEVLEEVLEGSDVDE